MQVDAAVGRSRDTISLAESRPEVSLRQEESQGHGPFLVLTAGAAVLLAYLLTSL